MADKTQTPDAGEAGKAAAVTTPAPAVAATAIQAAADQAVAVQKAKESREAKKAGGGSVELIAITDFTLVTDPAEPEGRLVRAGQTFTVAKADLPRYAGRGLPKPAED